MKTSEKLFKLAEKLENSKTAQADTIAALKIQQSEFNKLAEKALKAAKDEFETKHKPEMRLK